MHEGRRVLQAGRRWPWGMAIAVAALLTSTVWATWSGRCVDMAPGAGPSYCESGPAVGWPAALLVSAASLVVLIVAVQRLARRRPRQLPDEH